MPQANTQAMKRQEGTGVKRRKAPKRGRTRASPPVAARGAPVDRIERWPIARLIPYARNPKTHTPEQIEFLKRLWMTYGQTQLVVVDGDPGKEFGTIIVGHGRVMGGEAAGATEVMVGIAVGWTDDQKRALRIADNESGSERLAPWDDGLLKLELQALQLGKFDLNLTGFSETHLGVLLNGWSSDLDVNDRFGANTDGIISRIVVNVAQADADRARASIERALKRAAISYEF